MSNSEDSPLSPRRLLTLKVQNSRSEQQLSEELSQLDRKMELKLRQIQNETKDMLVSTMASSRSRVRSRSHSPAGRDFISASSLARRRPDLLANHVTEEEANRRSRVPRLPDIGTAPAPRASSNCSKLTRSTLATAQRVGKPLSRDTLDVPKNVSGKSPPVARKRPQPRRLEPISKPETQSLSGVSGTSKNSSGVEAKARQRTTAESQEQYSFSKTAEPVPQIVVSSAGTLATIPQEPEPEEKEKSESRPGLTRAPRPERVWLSIQPQRSRRHSEPFLSSLAFPLPSVSEDPGAVDLTPVHAQTTDVVHSVPGFRRPRSSTLCVPYFAHLKNSPRRQSLLRKYMTRPGLDRKNAQKIHQLISDLSRGISHRELNLYDPRFKPITDAEWQELKKCRYLRMPSYEIDIVKASTLDLDDIFSHKKV